MLQMQLPVLQDRLNQNPVKKTKSKKEIVIPLALAPTAPATTPTEPLARFQEKLTAIIFSAEARKKKKPSPKLEAVTETLRYIWDALEAAKK